MLFSAVGQLLLWRPPGEQKTSACRQLSIFPETSGWPQQPVSDQSNDELVLQLFSLETNANLPAGHGLHTGSQPGSLRNIPSYYQRAPVIGRTGVGGDKRSRWGTGLSWWWCFTSDEFIHKHRTGNSFNQAKIRKTHHVFWLSGLPDYLVKLECPP